MYSSVKCKKCRNLIFGQEQCQKLFLSAHNAPLEGHSESECNVENLFLNEDNLPEWIIDKVKADNWSKGRINCVHCESRVGGFNFVSGQKCDCSSHILPCVHLIKSKVDLIKS